MVPRINLRPEGPSSLANTGTSSPRSPKDGSSPVLFEVLGAPGGSLDSAGGSCSSLLAGGGGWMGVDTGNDVQPMRGSTSLENVPPPTLDPRMWSEADGTQFSVRGGSYLTTRIKVSSAKQVLFQHVSASGKFPWLAWHEPCKLLCGVIPTRLTKGGRPTVAWAANNGKFEEIACTWVYRKNRLGHRHRKRRWQG